VIVTPIRRFEGKPRRKLKRRVDLYLTRRPRQTQKDLQFIIDNEYHY
jgi:hypothetical protein